MTYSDYMTAMQHDDGSVGTADLVALYEQEISDLKNAVAGMTTDQLRSRPIPGKWSTLEVVCHLADTGSHRANHCAGATVVDRRPYPNWLNYQALDLDEQLACVGMWPAS